MKNGPELSKKRHFDWDEGNAPKIWAKHEVTMPECEEVLTRHPLVAGPDVEHSDREDRYFALGRTDLGRRLFVVFTLRDELIRVISAREMSRRERRVFADVEEES
jgi:uncharacterized DUF497 family protein